MNWKEKALTYFNKELFFTIPEHFRSEHGNTLERWSTWDKFVNDSGYKTAAILSFMFKPKVIVEFGVHFGWTSLLWCKFNPTARVHGVDRYGHPHNSILPTGYVPLMHDCKNYSLHIADSYNFSLPEQVNLCFIDGWHFAPTVLKDCWRAWENCNKNEPWCILWDDYAPGSPDVVEAVDIFTKEIGYELHELGGWKWIGNIQFTEAEAETFFYQ